MAAQNFAVKFLVLFFIALSIVLPTALTYRHNQTSGDFLFYWAGAKALVNSQSPYDPATLESTVLAIDPEVDRALKVYTPPQVFSYLFPLGYLNFDAARIVWQTFEILLIFLFAFILLEHFPLNYQSNSRRAVMLVALLVAYQPIQSMIALAQVALPVCVIFYLYYCLEGKPDRKIQLVKGVLLSLLLIKAHLTLPYVTYRFIRLVRNHSLFEFLGFALGLVIIVAIPLTLYPNIYVDYWAHRKELSGSAMEWFTPTVGAWLQSALSSNNTSVRFLPLGIGLCLSAYFAFASKPTKQLDLIWIPLISITAAPYAWTYDFLFLLPTHIFLLHLSLQKLSASTKRSLRFPCEVLLFFGPILSFLVGSESMAYDVAYPLTLLLWGGILTKSTSHQQ